MQTQVWTAFDDCIQEEQWPEAVCNVTDFEFSLYTRTKTNQIWL